MIWREVPLKRLFESATGGSWGAEPGEADVVAPCIRGTDFAYQSLRVDVDRAPLRGFSQREVSLRSARSGDLIIEKSGGGEQQPVGRAVLYEGTTPIIPTNFAARLRPSSLTEPRFAVYLLASLYTDGRTRASIKQTTGIQNLDLDSLLSNRVRLPSVVAQTKIADYLDAETTRIDALIAKRRRMIELLELRQDIAIREAVALAHATSQPLRQPLKRRWRVIDCKHRTPAYAETGYPVVSPGDVTPGNLDLSRCHRFVGEADFRDLTEGRGARRGDIIYSRNASIGIASYVATDEPFTMGQDVCLITSDDADQRYLTYYLNTFGLDQLDEAKIGSTFSRVNISQIKELLVPVLSRLEQSRIADQLDATSARYRRSTASLTRQIELLVERRQALITAAVTGELDIAGVAA